MRQRAVSQEVFDFWPRAASGRSDFFVSASNQAAIEWIERWPAWPTPALLLHGPEGCGKTHLVQIWQERAGAGVAVAGGRLNETSVASLVALESPAVAIDDADHAPERALLHLYNLCVEGGGTLLLTARRPAGPWPIGLADLGSRMRASLAVAIEAPDDMLLSAVLIKQFADRRVPVAPDLVAYLLGRIERSLAAARATVAALDRAALSGHRPITTALARAVLGHPFSSGSESGVT